MINVRHKRFVLAVAAAGLVLFPFLLSTGESPRIEAGGATPVVLSLAEQLAITGAAFVLKPLYQLLSLVIVLMLWKRTDGDLTALKLAMLAFFVGENACAANYLFFQEQSPLMEFFHTYGMVACFGLASYALMEAFDSRVFHFSQRDQKCVLLPLCRRCYKYDNSSCTLRLLFLFVIPATAALAAMPLTAVLGSHFFAGTVFSNSVIFGQPLTYQFLEARLYPLTSLPFFALSFLVLLALKENGFATAKIAYAMGTGLLGFSLMRFFLYWGYRENPLWADAWEEITEFLFVSLVFTVVLRIRAVSRLISDRNGKPPTS